MTNLKNRIESILETLIDWYDDNADNWKGILAALLIVTIEAFTGLAIGMLIAHAIHTLGKGKLDFLLRGGLYDALYISNVNKK